MDLKEVIKNCCIENISDDGSRSWFLDKLQSTDSATSFFLTFGMINRKIASSSVSLDLESINQIKSFDQCFDPGAWKLNEFCRLALLLNLPTDSNVEKIGTLLSTADIGEQVSIYKSFIFLGNAEDFSSRMIDGIRTNMIAVFDAIALNNSFPAKHFEEDAWNQMVLKAIFMERPIFRIFGIEERNNQKLSNILRDFVHERWSAGRSVTPELWRMMNGFVNEAIVDDLKKVIQVDSPIAQNAAAKLIVENNDQKAIDWLKTQNIEYSKNSWDEIGRTFWSSQETN